MFDLCQFFKTSMSLNEKLILFVREYMCKCQFEEFCACKPIVRPSLLRVFKLATNGQYQFIT